MREGVKPPFDGKQGARMNEELESPAPPSPLFDDETCWKLGGTDETVEGQELARNRAPPSGDRRLFSENPPPETGSVGEEPE